MAGFGKVAVIGYGVITGKVLDYVYKHSDEYLYSVFYVEHEVYPFNSARKYAEANELEYHQLMNKDDVTGLFEEKAQNDNVLIISASNNFLFPDSLIKNKNIKIINFHNALLPELPGRNAPSWAIYNGLRKTGITWHYVTEGIDEGDIIIQKECTIDCDTKAYELAAVLMDLAYEAFQECFSGIINNEIEPKKQRFANNRKVYKSIEIPGNGWFDLDDNPEDIYRLLRAMDYGKNEIFPLPRTKLNEQEISIKRYKKIELKDSDNMSDRIYLPLDESSYLMLKY